MLADPRLTYIMLGWPCCCLGRQKRAPSSLISAVVSAYPLHARHAQGALPRQWMYINFILEHASAFVPVSMPPPPEAPPGMCCPQLWPLCSPHISSPPERQVLLCTDTTG